MDETSSIFSNYPPEKFKNMKVHEKIRALRNVSQYTQEYMAERLGISTSGYAKMERGITRLSMEKLEQISQILGVEFSELATDKNIICFIGDNNENNHKGNTYYAENNELTVELDKLELKLKHKQEVIEQYRQQIEMQKTVISQKDEEILFLRKLLEKEVQAA